jgi:PAS domain S-box-containing protein
MTHANDARSKVRNRGRELAPVPSSFYGAVVGWNKGAQDLYGYTAGEMIGQPVAIVVPEPLHEESLQFLLDTCAQPLLRKETDRKREKGILVEVSLLFSPARNSKGEIIGGSTIAPAITERKGSEDLRERLAALVESSDDAIIGKSLDGTITSWNAGAERMFGYSSSEAVGKPIQMLLPPERANEESAILAQIGKGERIDHFETVRVGQDAKRVDVSVTISPIRDRRGRIVGASKIARDIGERKRAEAVQERLAAVLESSDDAIIGESLDGTITSWNRGAEDLFGYSESEAVGKFIQMLLPPDRANEEFDILARLKNGERINHFETVRVQKDGKRINVSVTISPIRDSSGAIIGASKIARDISERKCVEEELRKAEERFGKAFRSNPLAVSISTRAEGRYLDVNDSFLKILGYKRGDVIGRTASGLSFWAQPSEREQMLKLLDDNGRVTELHTQCKTSIGELREAELSAELIELEGQPCVLAITRDITETHRSWKRSSARLRRWRPWGVWPEEWPMTSITC